MGHGSSVALAIEIKSGKSLLLMPYLYVVLFLLYSLLCPFRLESQGWHFPLDPDQSVFCSDGAGFDVIWKWKIYNFAQLIHQSRRILINSLIKEPGIKIENIWVFSEAKSWALGEIRMTYKRQDFPNLIFFFVNVCVCVLCFTNFCCCCWTSPLKEVFLGQKFLRGIRSNRNKIPRRINLQILSWST